MMFSVSIIRVEMETEISKTLLLWRIDALLTKYLERNNETKVAALQRRGKHNSYRWKRCFLLGPCKGVIRKTIEATQSVESEEKTRRLM
jgi:hypothetical protein